MTTSDVFVASIDQGTTSTRVLIFQFPSGELIASHHNEFKQIHPHSGWHEHDPDEIVESVHKCIEGAVQDFESKGHAKESIKAAGIATQRETTVVWNKKTGKALTNGIVWTDTRNAALVRELKARPGADKLHNTSGLFLSTYPSATKLLWLLKNDAEVKKSYDAGELAWGTIDSWLIYKLNEQKVFATDVTNASRSMFLDIEKLQYSDQLLDFFSYEFDLRKIEMAKVVKSASSDSFGKIESGTLKGVPITGCLGDQSAALVGQKAFEVGSAKNTYGTGCFLLNNTGTEPVISKNGLLTTVAYDLGDGPRFALEGSIAVAGSAVNFLSRNLGFAENAAKFSELADSVSDSGGVCFVPAFSGLFAPFWVDSAQGTLFGITAHTQKGHIARAAFDATCIQTQAILHAMEQDSGQKLKELRVDGGMARSDLCMQIQADVARIPIRRPQVLEATCLGAAIAAGLAIGVWKDLAELKDINTTGETIFEPKVDDSTSKKMITKFEKAINMSKGWLTEKEESAEAEDQSSTV